ncbi:DUF2325 domain-containing protein [Pelomicrobium sp. G1]|uniref:DUF2325 domain-containing protein n=1 Tax=unclassified Pelomicrobium TaxID=2815318 RepID=UPI000AEE82D0|nr:MAG: hypothetical protein KatS3mg123_2166 [Burkholderiales bacterium]
MNALIVGADRLGNIPSTLAALGIRVVDHVSGRQAAHQRRVAALSREVDLLILFTDFLSHNVMRGFRESARAQGIPVLACRRSVSCLVQSLTGLGLSPREACGGCPVKAKPGGQETAFQAREN